MPSTVDNRGRLLGFTRLWRAKHISEIIHIHVYISGRKVPRSYVILGIDPKSDSETIQKAYSALAQRFHPNNSSTGSKEKFDAVTLAYEVLSEPQLRREFDKLSGVGTEEGRPKFSGAAFFNALGNESSLRAALLCILYDRRWTNSIRPSLSLRQIENMLVVTPEALAFTLWYLKQRNLVRSDDKSSLQITVEGMDYLESNMPLPEVVMPFVKP